MKILTTLILFACIAAPAISKAQQPTPTKGDNRITVHTPFPKDSLFNTILLQLAERGYAIDHEDRRLGLLSTAERTPPKFGSTVKLSAIVKDSIVTFYGQSRDLTASRLGSSIFLSGPEDIYSGTLRGSNMKQAFEEMDAVAGLLPGNRTYWKK